MVNPLNNPSPVAAPAPARESSAPDQRLPAPAAGPGDVETAKAPALDASHSRARFGQAVSHVDLNAIAVPEGLQGTVPLPDAHADATVPGYEPPVMGNEHAVKGQGPLGHEPRHHAEHLLDLQHAPPKLVKQLMGLKGRKSNLGAQRAGVRDRMAALAGQMRTAPHGSQLAIDLKFQMSSLAEEGQMLGIAEQECDLDIQTCITEISFAG